MTIKMRSRRNYHYLQLVLCLFLSTYISMQTSAQIVVNADSVVQLGETYKLCYQYSDKDSIDGIVSPSWDWEKNAYGYEVLVGPTRSLQSSFALVNGQITTIHEETFTFLLNFNREGLYSMPIMKAQTVLGEEVTSKPFVVRVTKDPVPSSSNDISSNDLLVIEATIDKNHIVLGDSIECEIRLYTNMNVTQLHGSSIFDITPAYWKYRETPIEKSFETVEYKGNTVRSILWQKASIIPLQAGEIELKPMKYTATIQDYDSSVDPFEAFFNEGSGYTERDTFIMTNPIKIQVENRHILSNNTISKYKTIATHSLGVVLDRSSSLLAQTDSLSPTFLSLENHFLEQLIKDKAVTDYSVLLFSGKPHVPQLTNLSDILQLSPSKDNDGSAIYNAILASALHENALNTESFPYSVLLLTDGADNASRLSEGTLTNLLLQNNIRVDVVAFASKKDSVFYYFNDSIGGTMIKNVQDYRDVERIARATNGEFILIENKKQIPIAVSKIQEKILKAETPKQKPRNDFQPDKTLLNTLYKEIMMNAFTDF